MAFPAEMVRSASPARPLLLMLAAMAAFVANDTLVKTVVNDLPVGEIVAVRGVAATLFIAAIARAQGHAFSPARMFSKAVVLRASLDAAATLLFIAALASMQIANLTAVMQAVPLSASQLLRLAVAALLLGIGYMCMVATLRMAQLSVTAPARYSIIVFAILSGIFVFGQFPDHWALLGIAMIVITGLYAIYRERMPSTQL